MSPKSKPFCMAAPVQSWQTQGRRPPRRWKKGTSSGLLGSSSTSVQWMPAVPLFKIPHPVIFAALKQIVDMVDIGLRRNIHSQQSAFNAFEATTCGLQWSPRILECCTLQGRCLSALVQVAGPTRVLRALREYLARTWPTRTSDLGRRCLPPLRLVLNRGSLLPAQSRRPQLGKPEGRPRSRRARSQKVGSARTRSLPSSRTPPPAAPRDLRAPWFLRAG
jgi:hypothetical protein